jgi:hypothetical protein
MPAAAAICPAFETWIPKPSNLNFVQASYRQWRDPKPAVTGCAMSSHNSLQFVDHLRSGNHLSRSDAADAADVAVQDNE